MVERNIKVETLICFGLKSPQRVPRNILTPQKRKNIKNQEILLIKIFLKELFNFKLRR